MPDSFIESGDGVLLVANGIDRVVRWDGFADSFTEAGVRAPTTPIGIVSLPSLNGNPIVGTYAAYLRYVDKYGNFSDLTPVSAEVVVNGRIQYGNVSTPSQSTVARRQILRNTDGQFRTFYVDVDTTDLNSLVLYSDNTDAVIQNNTAVPLYDANGNSLANLYGQPPATKPFLAWHLNRAWAAGEQPYAEGSVYVAAGSNAVYGTGTRWPDTFAGRFLYVTGASKAYEIESVNVAAQTLTLTEVYADANDQYAAYSVKPPPAEASLLYYSEAGLPEAWPAVNALSLPEDGDAVTGLFNYGSFLYVMKRNRLYQVSAQTDPATDGFVFPSVSRGCVNHRCVVVVDDAAYLMDEGGVYRFTGGTAAETISTPIQNLFRRNEPGTVNWQAQRFFHAVFDPSAEVIRWFVSLSGGYLPRHALALHYKTGKWWVEEYAVPVGASCTGSVGRPTGRWGEDSGNAVFVGGPASEAYTLGGTTLDGVASDDASVRGVVTSAGLDSLTSARADFDTSWANVPVAIVGGTGRGQVRVVVEATATTLTVNEPWSVTPDATSVFQVGGFNFSYKSQRMRFAASEDATGRSLEIVYLPTAAEMSFQLALFHDFAADAVEVGRNLDRGKKPGTKASRQTSRYEIDLSYPAGARLIRFDGNRELAMNSPRMLSVEVSGQSGPERVRIGEAIFNGLVR